MAKARIHTSDIGKNKQIGAKTSPLKKSRIKPGTLGEFWYSDVKCTDDFMVERERYSMKEAECEEWIHEVKSTPATPTKRETLKEFLKSHIRCTDDFFPPERSAPSKERDDSK